MWELGKGTWKPYYFWKFGKFEILNKNFKKKSCKSKLNRKTFSKCWEPGGEMSLFFKKRDDTRWKPEPIQKNEECWRGQILMEIRQNT